MKAIPSVCERPVRALRTFPDEWIEYWAAAYLARENNVRLRALRVDFERFLCAPVVFLAALHPIHRPRGTSGLLPAQRAVQKRFDAQAALLEIAERAADQVAAESHCANGAIVEKLKHHAWPRRPRRKSSLVTET